MNSLTYYTSKVKSWLFDVKEEKHISRSKYHKFIEKLPLIMAMYGSSVLVAISTYQTFPTLNPFLRYSSAGIGGMAFDVILTATVFSLRKNKFSLMTILAALITGLAIALDLYLQLGYTWLHALYIVMATLFALHLATTRGRTVEELERTNAELSTDNAELNETTKELQDTTTKLQETVENLTADNERLNTRVENYNEVMIEKLAGIDKLTANDIVALIGGNRQAVLEKIKQYRIQ
jgi:preprotein translocase subunit SecF